MILQAKIRLNFLSQEAALYVVNTRSIEEALSIFTEVNNLLSKCIFI